MVLSNDGRVGRAFEHRAQKLLIKNVGGIRQILRDFLLNRAALLVPEFFIGEQVAHPSGFDAQGHVQIFRGRGEEILRDGLLGVGIVVAAHRGGRGGELVGGQAGAAAKHHVLHRVRAAGKFRRTFVGADAVIDHRGDDGREFVGHDDDLQAVGERGAQDVGGVKGNGKCQSDEQRGKNCGGPKWISGDHKPLISDKSKRSSFKCEFFSLCHLQVISSRIQVESCTGCGTVNSMIGQFLTPDIVAECMFRLAGVRVGQRVIDPSCGDGSFLRKAPHGVELFGCEIDPQYAQVACHLVSGKRFVQDDALMALVPLWDTCDLVIGNPPFSAQANLEKRPEVLQGYDLGIGKKSQCFEVLFLELFLKLAKPAGKIAIILPDGPFGNRPFKYVREWLLRHARVEAIVSLPRGIFNRTTAKTNILIAQRQPFSAQPSREPTQLLKCNDLSELKPLRLADWTREDSRWRRVILADEDDWRPEAQSNPGRNHSANSVRLGDVFGLRTGFALYAEKRKFFDAPGENRLLLIRAKNLAPEGGMRLNENCAYISRTGEMFREQSVVRPGEILFVRVGAGCYGRTALVPRGLDAQADDWILVLTPHVKVDGSGVVDWFNSEAGRVAVRRLAKGVGTLSVSKSSLAELRIPAKLVRR